MSLFILELAKYEYSIIKTEQNTTPKYKQDKIQTWQNAKIPKYKNDELQKDKIQMQQNTNGTTYLLCRNTWWMLPVSPSGALCHLKLNVLFIFEWADSFSYLTVFLQNIGGNSIFLYKKCPLIVHWLIFL